MIPVARTDNILITEVDNEVMIYDRETDACHCLNSIATKVYHYADGRNTVDDIATFLEQELELSEDVDIRGLVWLALEELEKCHLLKEYLREPLPDAREMSRRKVLGKTIKFAGAVAIGTLFPMIQSVVAPKPTFAGSPPPPTPQHCGYTTTETTTGTSGRGRIEKTLCSLAKSEASAKACTGFSCPPGCGKFQVPKEEKKTISPPDEDGLKTCTVTITFDCGCQNK
jgi:hypothetical protein